MTPNGVDAAFTPDGERQGGDPYLLFVGALRSRKDPVTALEALARLPVELRLVMIGPPKGEQDRVEAAIERLGLRRRVDVLGHVGQSQLAAYYRGAQCLVLPSLYEGFGLPVLEAMACGTPVVSTAVCSIPEIAGNAAVLVPPATRAPWRQASNWRWHNERSEQLPASSRPGPTPGSKRLAGPSTPTANSSSRQ